MACIFSIPQELVVDILASCDSVFDVVKFAQSCKQLNTTWETHAPSILESIGSRSMLYYDTRLLVVRATNIVKAAFDIGHLPPHISPLDPQLLRPGPSIAEYRQICGYESLIEFVESSFLRSADTKAAVRPWPYRLFEYGPPDTYRKPWYPSTLHPSSRERIRRTMYRLMLAGAVCSRAYNEPFRSDDAPLVFKEGFRTARRAGWMCTKGPVLSPLNDSEADYVRSFAAFSSDRRGAGRDTAFPKSFTTWFTQDVVECFVREQQGDRGQLHKDITLEKFAQAEISSMSIVFQEFRKMVVNSDGSDRNLRPVIREPLLQTQPRMPIVVFGVFQAEWIALPHQFSNSMQPWLLATPMCEPNGPGMGSEDLDVERDKVTEGVHCDIAKVIRKVYPANARGVDRRHVHFQHFETLRYGFLDCSLLETIGIPDVYDEGDLDRRYSAVVNGNKCLSPGMVNGHEALCDVPDCWHEMRYAIDLPQALMYGLAWENPDDSSPATGM